MEKFAVFKIGKEDFGVSINMVVEILKSQKIYFLPELPDFISGVINVRGEVIPLLDLRKRFGAHTETDKCRIIVVHYEDEKIGLLVDEIDEIVPFSPEEISTPPAMFKGLKTEYLTGLGKKEERIVILLNIERLLTSKEKIMLSASSDSFASADLFSTPPQADECGLRREEESTGLIADGS
ncbi:MAG: chemotaxis protein CheW [Nitrospirota bacterium]|nr:chemotaxis protein CheW [Nitrospirota bacterium]